MATPSTVLDRRLPLTAWTSRIMGSFFVVAGATWLYIAPDHPDLTTTYHNLGVVSVLTGAADLILVGGFGRRTKRVIGLLAAVFFTAVASKLLASASGGSLLLTTFAIAAFVAAAWGILEIHLMVHRPADAGETIHLEDLDVG